MKKSGFKFWGTALVIGLSLGLGACQKSDSNSGSGGGGGGTTAQTPVPEKCNLPNNQYLPASTNEATACEPDFYRQHGWQPLPYQWDYQNDFCGCPVGHRPVYAPDYGFGCAPNNVLDLYPYENQQLYTYQNQNTQWLNQPQQTYLPLITSYSNNCYSGASRVCNTNEPNSCGEAGQCRPAGGGSILGVCTYGVGVDPWGYGNYQYKCTYYNEAFLQGYYCYYTSNSYSPWSAVPR